MNNWRKINLRYKVSNKGLVKNTETGMLVNITVNYMGYCMVSINNKPKQVHTLVGNAFIPNPEKKKCMNHINNIKTDNRVENLEWSTHKENTQHSYAMGGGYLRLKNPETIKKYKKIRAMYLKKIKSRKLWE